MTINAGAGDDSISIQSGSNILFKYRAGEGNDLIEGFNSTSTLSISGGLYSTQKSGTDVVVTVGEGKITLVGAANLSKLNISSPILTLTNADAANRMIASNLEIVEASARTKATKIFGNNLNNTILGGGGKDTFYGKDGNDYLVGNAGNDYLRGQNGDDTIDGGKGNDSLSGGKGKDIFVFSAGNDTITDYTAGEDKIRVTLSGGSFDVSKKDIVLNYGANNLTIIDGLDKTIAFDDGSRGTFTAKGRFNGKSTAVTLPTSSKSFKTSSYAELVTVDGSAANYTIKIIGNRKNNYLVAGNNGSTLSGGKGNDKLLGGQGKDSLSGGTGFDYLNGGAGDDTVIGGNGKDTLYGGAGKDILDGGAGSDILSGGDGNDTLWGGANNDILRGGAGDDIFICKPNEGSDYIMDYEAGDLLQILKTDGALGSFTNSSFNGNQLTLEIEGGGHVMFSGVNARDLFNINGTSYSIKGTKLK